MTMIFGGIYNGIKNLLSSNKQSKFIIYDAQVLQAQNKSQYEQYALLQFDGIDTINYKNNVQIPTQSLENRQFSNDTIIDNPFRLDLMGVISQSIYTASDLYSDKEGAIVNTLDYILKSNTLLVILRNFPLSGAYINMKLEEYNLPKNSYNIGFSAHLTLREIRTIYIPTSLNNDNFINNNNSFSPNQSNNPTTKNQVDNGFIAPVLRSDNINNLQG